MSIYKNKYKKEFIFRLAEEYNFAIYLVCRKVNILLYYISALIYTYKIFF